MDTHRLIAELDAERARSQRLELQTGELLGQVAALTRQVAELTERLGQNSRNSHRPPSSDPPGAGTAGHDLDVARSDRPGNAPPERLRQRRHRSTSNCA